MFREDQPFGKVVSALFDQFFLSMCFCISSFPVFTAGAAAVAMYEVQYALREGRSGNLAKDYFFAFRRNFKKGCQAFLVILALVILAVGGCYGALAMGFLAYMPARILAAVVLAVLGFTICWMLPLLARFDQKLLTTLYNAYRIGLENLLYSLLLLALNMAFPVLFLVVPQFLLGGYLFMLLFFSPGVSTMLSGRIVLWVLAKKYQTDGQG